MILREFVRAQPVVGGELLAALRARALERVDRLVQVTDEDQRLELAGCAQLRHAGELQLRRVLRLVEEEFVEASSHSGGDGGPPAEDLQRQPHSIVGGQGAAGAEEAALAVLDLPADKLDQLGEALVRSGDEERRPGHDQLAGRLPSEGIERDTFAIVAPYYDLRPPAAFADVRPLLRTKQMGEGVEDVSQEEPVHGPGVVLRSEERLSVPRDHRAEPLGPNVRVRTRCDLDSGLGEPRDPPRRRARLARPRAREEQEVTRCIDDALALLLGELHDPFAAAPVALTASVTSSATHSIASLR